MPGNFVTVAGVGRGGGGLKENGGRKIKEEAEDLIFLSGALVLYWCKSGITQLNQ